MWGGVDIDEVTVASILGAAAPQRQAGAQSRMFVVWAAWLYVIGMLALGARDLAQGMAIFLAFGVGPVLFMAWLAALRARRRSVRDEGADQPDREDA